MVTGTIAVTKAARKVPEDFELKKSVFLSTVRSIIAENDIPPRLVINWDQTGEFFHLKIPLDSDNEYRILVVNSGFKWKKLRFQMKVLIKEISRQDSL